MCPFLLLVREQIELQCSPIYYKNKCCIFWYRNSTYMRIGSSLLVLPLATVEEMDKVEQQNNSTRTFNQIPVKIIVIGEPQLKFIVYSISKCKNVYGTNNRFWSVFGLAPYLSGQRLWFHATGRALVRVLMNFRPVYGLVFTQNPEENGELRLIADYG